MKTRAAFFGDPAHVTGVFNDEVRISLQHYAELHPQVVTANVLDAALPDLGEIEVVFGTWGFPVLTAAQLARLPKLRAVFYAAGSVQAFARPLLERDITVTSAWRTNAVAVSEFVLGQILLACKGYCQNVRDFTDVATRAQPFIGPGNRGTRVALLGSGAVGTRLLQRLRGFELEVVVYDALLGDEAAEIMGIQKVDLDEAFATAQVVTNHLADKPATRGLINGPRLRALPTGATLINTGRGRTLDETALIETLQARPDLTALLDVTDPEPPADDSPLFALPNAYLTSHIAGTLNAERPRLAEAALDAFQAWRRGEAPRDAVTLAMLDRLA